MSEGGARIRPQPWERREGEGLTAAGVGGEEGGWWQRRLDREIEKEREGWGVAAMGREGRVDRGRGGDPEVRVWVRG